jgi:hypothetical protein
MKYLNVNVLANTQNGERLEVSNSMQGSFLNLHFCNKYDTLLLRFLFPQNKF